MPLAVGCHSALWSRYQAYPSPPLSTELRALKIVCSSKRQSGLSVLLAPTLPHGFPSAPTQKDSCCFFTERHLMQYLEGLMAF